jgi:hypothetical protein
VALQHQTNAMSKNLTPRELEILRNNAAKAKEYDNLLREEIRQKHLQKTSAPHPQASQKLVVVVCDNCGSKVAARRNEASRCRNCNAEIFLDDEPSEEETAQTPAEAELEITKERQKAVWFAPRTLVGLALIGAGLWLGYKICQYAGFIQTASTTSGWRDLSSENARSGNYDAANYYESRQRSAEALDNRKTNEVVFFFFLSAGLVFLGGKLVVSRMLEVYPPKDET